ncbi:MAG: Do family serine endopeptidase [Bdellovibrionota bacterium]|nr:Do family serine endopeptidase [Bdellovibrionota bacterium]
MKSSILLILSLSLLSPLAYGAKKHDLSTAFIKLAKKVNPAIVNIRTTQLPQRPNFRDPFMDMFEQFYGINPRRGNPQPSTALGTGFIISEDGLIITNNHVIDSADEIEVQLEENAKELYKAKVIGRDEKTDIALIKIDAKKKLPTAALGDSSKVEVGEWVAAFGNPLGLGHTVTKGIISQKGREVAEIGIYPFLQTDASINPGNSGGPLVNLDGDVIGVNTFIIKGAQGLGFAIPIDVVKNLLPQLKKNGKIDRGYLGISIAPITPRIQKALRLSDNKGVLVTDVMEGSAAEAAGVRPYDIIRKINKKEIEDIRRLHNEIAKYNAGTDVELELLRNQKTTKINVSLKTKEPGSPQKVQDSSPETLKAPYKLGFQVADLTKEMAQSIGVNFIPRPVVYEVETGSPAAKAGLSVGDIILDINRKKVKTARTAVRALREEANLVRVQRGSYIIVLYIEP